jgi:hypothetical protein
MNRIALVSLAALVLLWPLWVRLLCQLVVVLARALGTV